MNKTELENYVEQLVEISEKLKDVYVSGYVAGAEDLFLKFSETFLKTANAYADDKDAQIKDYIALQLNAILKGDDGDTDIETSEEISKALGGDPEAYKTLKEKIDAVNLRLPTVAVADNGKFLRVENGAWAAVEIPYAEGEEY